MLAAQTLLSGGDYAARWQLDLGPWRQAGIVNRWIFRIVGELGMRIAGDRLARRDAGELLRRAYDMTMLKRLALPLARRRYRAPLADPSCSHVNSDCVWCQHGDHNAARKKDSVGGAA